jgi:tetratricopeptide (TPR) repeat protein
MIVLQDLAFAYKNAEMNLMALDYFKRFLNLSWELYDHTAEIRAYENLASQYFMIGDFEKAETFYIRV